MPNFHCKKWSTFLYLNELQVKKKKNFLSFIFLKLKSGLIKLLLAILLLLFSDSRILIQKWRSPKKKKKKSPEICNFFSINFHFFTTYFQRLIWVDIKEFQRIFCHPQIKNEHTTTGTKEGGKKRVFISKGNKIQKPKENKKA